MGTWTDKGPKIDEGPIIVHTAAKSARDTYCVVVEAAMDAVVVDAASLSVGRAPVVAAGVVVAIDTSLHEQLTEEGETSW